MIESLTTYEPGTCDIMSQTGESLQGGGGMFGAPQQSQGGGGMWGSSPQQSQGGMFGSSNTGMGNMGMLGSLLGMGASSAGHSSAASSPWGAPQHQAAHQNQGYGGGGAAGGGLGGLASLFGGGGAAAAQQQSSYPSSGGGGGMWGQPQQQQHQQQQQPYQQQMGGPQNHPGGEARNAHGVLITGCQAHETSADACPSGDPSKAFGALTNALVTSVRAVKRNNPNANPSHKQLVQDVRSVLLKARYTQNPCLECTERDVDAPFIG